MVDDDETIFVGGCLFRKNRGDSKSATVDEADSADDKAAEEMCARGGEELFDELPAAVRSGGSIIRGAEKDWVCTNAKLRRGSKTLRLKVGYSAGLLQTIPTVTGKTVHSTLREQS
jgi:hypothetical protein